MLWSLVLYPSLRLLTSGLSELSYRFGDTVNTASRMESTSKKGKIQVSMTTADILRDSGKGHWIVRREDKVLAKGIGVVQTCWLRVRSEPVRENGADIDGSARYVDNSSHGTPDEDGDDDRYAGTVDWLTESLSQYLKVVVTQQRRSGQSEDSAEVLTEAEERILTSAKAPIEEMADTKIAFPDVENLESVQEEAGSIDLGADVMTQLRSLVWAIASKYVSTILLLSRLCLNLPCQPTTRLFLFSTATNRSPSTTLNMHHMSQCA
jgi:hypothetical protein